MYFVVCLSEYCIIGEAPDYNSASMILKDYVNESDGFYTENDLTILTEEELENYS